MRATSEKSTTLEFAPCQVNSVSLGDPNKLLERIRHFCDAASSGLISWPEEYDENLERERRICRGTVSERESKRNSDS